MRNYLAPLVFAVVLSSAGAANASIKVSAFQEMDGSPKTKPYADVYIEAYMQALTIANAALLAQGKAALYCPPGALALDGANARSLVTSALRNGRATPADDIGIVVIAELQRAFPCP
ncbi:MAG: hypothetical protein INH12_26755 [Cupriavidus sp.]|jgi:hypothetical protein|uniref:hypothetical protein n=1 Tax=Cupriavidus sp. TaxID=1873897 RepID=UPI0025BAFF3E|nr:hypothetical protein [Cupriavidus sp.]MCA3186456.1 hypothetical protein [Cupriavidus sp.]MCA3193679.1 hypothetical protein [Cupriavidus sp.]MCA3233548.1 hypothetical protein [Cupriavidus sp.]MCA3775559.1 hypothetical protein [Cutibacterium sp.]